MSSEAGITQLCVTLYCVSSRNITFSLPTDLLRQAKIYAAEHDTTVNALIRDLLEERVSREKRVRAAAERLLEIADRAPLFTADPHSFTREDLHDRR